jgi:hypothetical protein
VTSPGDVGNCREMISDLGVSVGGNEDVDEDVWLMANAGTLIMARSTLSLLGGVLNPFTSYTYEAWPAFDLVAGRTTQRSSVHLAVLPW